MTEKESTSILIIDDDKKLCRLLTDYLEPMGYKVATTFNGADGLKLALTGNHDALILDVMLPGMDGFEVLKNLRSQSDIPVVMLTARGDETDRIVGLEMGADDYLPKPFSPRELLARLRAVLRRMDKVQKIVEEKPNRLRIGNLALDTGARSAFLNGEELDLTGIEFDILNSLAQGAGRVRTRDRILDDIAGREYDVFDRSIDVHISALRKKLGDDPKQPSFIKTVRGTGYMLMRPSECDE